MGFGSNFLDVILEPQSTKVKTDWITSKVKNLHASKGHSKVEVQSVLSGVKLVSDTSKVLITQ